MPLPQKLNVLSPQDLEQIHETSIGILEIVGVGFLLEEARQYFIQAGYRVEGERVFFTREQVDAVLKTVPRQFEFVARNPDKSVLVGGPDPVFAVGYGPPFVTDQVNGRRRGTFVDYQNLLKILQTCSNIQVNSAIICEPQDLPESTRHLDMFHQELKLTDKPLMGSPQGGQRAVDCLNMAKIAFGEQDFDQKARVMALINVISPLRFDHRMLEALIAYAKLNQPTIIAAFAMGGASAPMTIAGLLAQQNAEVLAGITLSQLVRPGAPVVYGTASAFLDMRTANPTIGAPETALIVSAHAQLARYYDVPCRGGGGLCDSKVPDAQAGYESMMIMLATATSGIDFVLHAAGIVESFLTMSYEKLIIDNEILGMVRRWLRGIEVDSHRLALPVIQECFGSHFLEHDHTFEFYMTETRLPELSDRWGYPEWTNQGSTTADQRATQKWQQILAEYEAPALDAAVDAALQAFMAEARARIERELSAEAS